MVLSNTNNFKIDLFDPEMGSTQVLTFWIREFLGEMAMNGYYIFPISPELEPHHQM